MFAVAAPIGSVRAAARGASRVRRPSLVRAAAKGKKDVDWDAKTKELTAERVLEQCMEAMADGDEDRLEACLLELETPEETKEVAAAASANTDDEFWKKKLAEIAAARVLDNCMSAVMMGDSDEIEACMLDANNDTLLGERTSPPRRTGARRSSSDDVTRIAWGLAHMTVSMRHCRDRQVERVPVGEPPRRPDGVGSWRDIFHTRRGQRSDRDLIDI